MGGETITSKPRILALFGGAVLFGQERGNIEVLAALKEQGAEVLCLVRDEEWSVHIPPALDARELTWVKVPYIEHYQPGRFRYVLFRNPLAFIRANWWFMRIMREFRPTHIHAFNPVYVLNFLLALKLAPVPMIYRAGDEPTVHNWIWRTLWRSVARRTDRFVANARFVANSLCRNGVARERVTVIYNVPTRRDRHEETKRFVSNGHATCRVSYVGQISEHKGVHILVQAFHRVTDSFPSVQLTIAGRVSDWEGDAWARYLRDETLRDPVLAERVSFVGEISDVPDLLANSAVHVAPSLFEDPSPNVVMEAKEAGCPSIVFPRGGMPELVEDGVDGLVCREATVAALAEALRYYLSNPAIARQHGLASRASLDRLGVDSFAERWWEVYTNSTRSSRLPFED